MVRAIIGLLGALTARFPNGSIGVFEETAIENPDECTIKPWISSGVRAEGVLVVVASGGRAYARMTDLTGLFGAVVLLSPGLYRGFATAVLYEEPSRVEWSEGFTDGVRLVGALYVLLAIGAFVKRRSTD